MMTPGDRPARQGSVIPPPRGRILTPAWTSGPLPATTPLIERRWMFPVLLLALMMFGQSFQYINDVPPLYALTKGWPLVMMPLAVWGMMRIDLPYRPLLLIVLFWTLAVTPFVGIAVLGNSVLGALASTPKVWSLTTGFSLAAALVLMRPEPATIRRAVITLAAIAFTAFPILSALVPEEAYKRGIDVTKLFIWDEDRGYRLYVPMFFGLITMFMTARSCWERPKAWKIAVLVGCYFLLFTFYKQRTPIAMSGVVIIVGAVLSTRRWRPAAVVGLLCAGALASMPLYFYAQSDAVAQQLGGSLTVRQHEIDAAINFLNASPIRWLIGAGAATRIGNVSLGDIVGTDYFFLADIGWLGVIFEYGTIGAGLLLALALAGLKLTWEAARVGGPLAAALFDYILFFLFSSPVTPIVFLPGELMFCMAMGYYLLRRAREDGLTGTVAR
jgi:hypothetical protein